MSNRFWWQLFGQDRFYTRTLRALEWLNWPQNLGAPLEGDITTTILPLKKKKKTIQTKVLPCKNSRKWPLWLWTSCKHFLTAGVPTRTSTKRSIKNRHENFLFQSKILPHFKQQGHNFTEQESPIRVSEIEIKNSRDFGNELYFLPSLLSKIPQSHQNNRKLKKIEKDFSWIFTFHWKAQKVLTRKIWKKLKILV